MSIENYENYENTISDDEPITNDDAISEDMTDEVLYLNGVVANCLRLNIRKAPDQSADILATVKCLDELRIDINASTDEWYSVCTATGIEGYCMTKFVVV